MASYTDYAVSIDTTDPVLIDQLILISKGETNFLKAFSKTEKNRELDYYELALLITDNELVRFRVSFSARWGIDESIFDSIYETYCEVDPKLKVEVYLNEESNPDQTIVYFNGNWDSHFIEDEEDDEDEEV